jgi:hypothetical protein
MLIYNDILYIKLYEAIFFNSSSRPQNVGISHYFHNKERLVPEMGFFMRLIWNR